MEAAWSYTVFSLLLLLASFLFISQSKNRHRNLPPTPGLALPVIGHLHLISDPLHRSLLHLSRKAGSPVISLQLGSSFAVAVLSGPVAEECFTKNDIVLANRPRFVNGEYTGYNYTTVIQAPYGDHWRNLRRLMSTEILSPASLKHSLSIRTEEVRILLRNLHKDSGNEFREAELRPRLSELTFNVVMRMVSGKRYQGDGTDDVEGAREFREMIEEAFHLSGGSNPGNFLPIFRWINYQGTEKRWKTLMPKMDAEMQRMIEEHRKGRGDSTMIDHLLSLQESQPEIYTDQIIRGFVLDMILAGTDTSAVTLEWAMSCLLNHPEALKKARDELDHVVGPHRLVEESDMPKLPYLQHIISETLRLFPAAPMLLPHMTSSECTVGEYHVPRGAIVLVNAWAIHRDPELWEEPEKFEPERFEVEEKGGRHRKMLPFGMGRRACPGAGLAQHVVGLALGSLIQCFEWERVGGKEIDLAEGNGLSMPKAEPLVVMCKARDMVQNLII